MRELLRPGLLSGVSVFLAAADGGREGGIGETVRGTCTALGAQVAALQPDASKEAQADAAVTDAVERAAGIDLLAVDGAGLFAEGLRTGGDGHRALRACMDCAWNATRAVVNHAFLRTGEPRGRIVYIAPPPDAGEHADAVRAGLENLARTLSIEWARHNVTTVAIAPGVATSSEEVATLVAYLASPAGSYFSGCQLDLRGT